MGRVKDKVIRQMAANAAKRDLKLDMKKAKRAENEVKKLKKVYAEVEDEIEALLQSGMLVKFHPLRFPWEHEGLYSATDIKIEALMKKQAKLKEKMTRLNKVIEDVYADYFKRFNDEMDKQDPPAGGMGGDTVAV
jgi:predicted nuclease with TOPRIM domain